MYEWNLIQFYVKLIRNYRQLYKIYNTQVVTKLCATIREKDVAIIFDRFFTSVHLMQTLPFACVGTVITNRRNLPEFLPGKMQRGQSKSMCTYDGVICFKWQDSREVIVTNFKSSGS